MKASAVSSTATARPISPATSIARPDSFRLVGRSARPDPRINAYRGDLADIELAGCLFAPHYARASARTIGAASVMLRAAPSTDAPAVSQLLHGEGFRLLDSAGGWSWGRCDHDGYVGYLPDAALALPAEPTHRVTAPLAPLFARPDIKSPVLASWTLGARFAGIEADDFLDTGEGFVHRRHAAPLSEAASDPVAVAERLLGAPYLWGGRGAGGIDCSGLVQLALSFSGVTAPRDSDLQRDSLGRPLGEDEALQRGDMVFFPGHVAFMLDATRILHANAHWMAVTVEPLSDLVGRLASTHGEPILARRRLA